MEYSLKKSPEYQFDEVPLSNSMTISDRFSNFDHCSSLCKHISEQTGMFYLWDISMMISLQMLCKYPQPFSDHFMFVRTGLCDSNIALPISSSVESISTIRSCFCQNRYGFCGLEDMEIVREAICMFEMDCGILNGVQNPLARFSAQFCGGNAN